MKMESRDSSTSPAAVASDVLPTRPADSALNSTSSEASSKQPFSGLSSWAKNLKIPQPAAGGQEDSPGENSGKSAFARFTSSLSMRVSPKEPAAEPAADEESSQSNLFGAITKGLVDSSKSAVRAVTVKARHAVSQNKRRYQEDGFDLDLTYITENILAMGFPAGDMSSGFFGYVEGIYRNHMEEVISFLESRHKGKYKVYNLCSERLYDASLFEGKVASFPFDDHNCPPVHLITLFCQSAYSWLKEDIENVVAVHCKAGMARTGLMISSLLLYLKFFPTAEESIESYNQKRCIDGKALVLPSQIRYVKYFERVLTCFNGENQPGRRCMLRGFRLHRCPYWIRPHVTVSNHNGVLFCTKKHPRTKDMSPEDFWFSAPKKGIMVFALPGEPGLTELAGDFKVHFHDRQGDFYFWLNTTMVENRKILNTSDMDGFDKRKLPSPGFQVEIVLVDYDGTPETQLQPESDAQKSNENPAANPTPANESSSGPNPSKESQNQLQSDQQDKDVFSDDDADESRSSKSGKTRTASPAAVTKSTALPSETNTTSGGNVEDLTHEMAKSSLVKGDSTDVRSTIDSKIKYVAGSGAAVPKVQSSEEGSDFKAMAADASVFTFGDDEDYEIVGCLKLKDTEWISRQDPYVCLEYANTKFRTRTCTDGGKNPVFQEKFVFTLIEGLREINIVVWNSNTLSFDDFIGGGKAQLQDVLLRGYDDRPWPLQTKTGRYAGEVKLIMHYANAQRSDHTNYASAPPFPTPHQPQTPMYSSAYPSAPSAYQPPPTCHHHPPTSYSGNSPYAYPPDPTPYSPYPYPPPNNQSAYPPAPYPPPPSTYPPTPYPPASAYPPMPYPPPSYASPYPPTGNYPGQYPRY